MGSAEGGDRSILNYPFYGSSNWDPIVSLSQSGDFVGEFSNPHLVHIPPDPSLVDMMPKFSSTFGSSSGRVSEPSHDYPDFAPKSGVGNQRALNNIADSQEHGPNLEDGLLGSSPYGKRKRKVPVGPSLKNAEEQQKDHSGDTSKSPKEDNGKKKSAAKHTKDNSACAEPAKEEDYIHMRAKRGQATNSHSLAERVRREKISERMRLLQDLVPGCNKITGKALMLDEIINYVQSLQQQVEFLSMKLATVNPELNVDIDTILSKNILHLHGSNPAAIGISSGYPQSTFHGTTSPFHPMPQHIWNNDLHGILQMELDHDHDHDPSVTSLGPNGLSKMEL